MARVGLDNGHIVVVPNHGDTDIDEDEEMYDEDDAMAELDADNSMDLYE